MIRPARLFLSMLVLGLAGLGGILVAQIEPGDRGIAPIDSSSSYEVAGVAVDVVARDADSARTAGWREAQRKAWKSLYGRLHGMSAAAAPGLPDGTLDGIVAGIVVEDEEIGPTRYIARLGVLFDRARAGALLGVHGQAVRSAPMLVIPTMWSAGALTSLELRNPWQAAWARFRTGTSAIDYVRPRGNGVDPLLLNFEQTRRPGRRWWRMLLEQYGAADVVMPQVALRRTFPGGPVIGRFIARHGPDGEIVGAFDLTAVNATALPKMLDDGVRRIDEAYTIALRGGALGGDPTLIEEEPAPEEIEQALDDMPLAEDAAPAPGQAYIIQVETPDAAAVGAAEGALRAVPGVRASATQSLALGGTSVIRIVYDGDIDGLRLALAARGWQAEGSGGTLRVRRAGGGATPVAPLASPQSQPPPQP